MKSGTLVTVAAGLIVAGGIAATFLRAGTVPKPMPVIAAPTSTVVQVDELAEHPEQYAGLVTVRAVVAGVNQSNHVFGIVDAREFEACGITTCARYTVPVRYGNELPGAKQVVLVTGRLVKQDNGLVFVAERVERVP